jgi:hypothetical protein
MHLLDLAHVPPRPRHSLKVFRSFELILLQLVEPVVVRGEDRTPLVRLTVLAHTDPALQPSHPVSVLLFDTPATRSTAPALAEEVHSRLRELESVLSAATRPAPAAPPLPSQGDTAVRDASFRQGQWLQPKRDLGLAHAVAAGVAAVQQMERDNAGVTAVATLIIVTDGVVSFGDARLRIATMDRLHRSDMTCSFVQVGQVAAGPLDPVRDLALARSWGHVADTELLLHIAECAGGSVLFAADLVAPGPPRTSATSSRGVAPAGNTTTDNGGGGGGGGDSTATSSIAAKRLGTVAQRAFMFPATPCCGGPSAVSEGMSESMFVVNEVGGAALLQCDAWWW